MNARSIRFLFLGDLVTDRRVKNFIRYFRSRDWQTELLVSTTNAALSKQLADDLAANIHTLRFKRGPLMFWEHHRSLLLRIRNLPPANVTVACELYSLSAARYAKRNELTKHLTYDAREVYTGLPTVIHKPLVRWFWKWIESRGMIQTDSIMVTAPLDVAAIQNIHHFLPRSFLVRNLPMHTETPKQNQYLRERFSIPADRHILVYIGGIQPHRGLEQIIDAMPRLRDKAVFIAIGEGALRSSLESRIRNAGLTDCIYFHDAVASEDALPILASADIGISLIDTSSPSYALALPSKIYEYFLAGIPVLTTSMKQVVAEFGTHPAIHYAELNEDAIVKGAHELTPVTRDTDLMRRIQKEAELYTFEHDAQHFAEFLEQRIQ